MKNKDDFHKEIRLKRSFKHKLFLADAMAWRLHLRDQMKSGLVKKIHIKRSMICSGSCGVFTEDYIKVPVQLVFNGPMLPDGIRKVLHTL